MANPILLYFVMLYVKLSLGRGGGSSDKQQLEGVGRPPQRLGQTHCVVGESPWCCYARPVVVAVAYLTAKNSWSVHTVWDYDDMCD